MSLTKASFSMITGSIGNILDYGAVAFPTRAAAIAGSGDSSAALQSALNDHASVFIPAGYYRIENTVVLYSGKKIFGENFNASNLIGCGTLGSTGRNVIESARVNVITDGGTDAQIVIEDLNIDGGGNGAPYANGIELGSRNPNPGNGVLFEMRRINLNYCQNGMQIHGATFSVMETINITGYDANSSGYGVLFDRYTNGLVWYNGLVSDFATNIQISGGGCTFIEVAGGTAANGAYGTGWTNTWTQNIWYLNNAQGNYFLRCGSEYLTPRAISEVTLISTSSTTPNSIQNVFEQFYWAGVNTSSTCRVRVGVAGGSYNPVSKTVFRDCIFLAGIPISGSQYGDIWIDNAENTLIEYSSENSGYYDPNDPTPLIYYTTGNATSTNTKIIPWATTLYVVGASGQPSFQNSWAAYSNSAYQAPAFYIDGATNVVHLTGIAAGGTTTQGTVIFTLPAGFRPNYNEQFAVINNNSFGSVQVGSNGQVTIQSGGNTTLSFSGISFRATQ